MFPLLLALVLLACLWPLSLFASSVVSKPLHRLYTSMERFKEGDFNQRVEVSGGGALGMDEIGELSLEFNRMVREIKGLIDKNYALALHERQSELSALQAQINPHFLYNTLDSLYWEAFGAGSGKLAEDILSLSQLFRLTLARGEDEVPVSREFELVSHYLHLQKMRFGRKLEYSVELDGALRDRKIQKLVLQPFVENACVHGLELTGRAGSIAVTGSLAAGGGWMEFEVRDNGAGIPAGKLAALTGASAGADAGDDAGGKAGAAGDGAGASASAGTDADAGLSAGAAGDGAGAGAGADAAEDEAYRSERIGRYAIRNVRRRLELRYGEGGFSLGIESAVGVGTTVRLRIPAGG
jgi:two-component system sensor histidine kinase YesM